MFVNPNEILMGRDVQYPLSSPLKQNLDKLLIAVNKFRVYYGKPLVVSSGYRPDHFNSDAGGAPNSPHKTCEAVDFHDSDGAIKQFVLDNPHVLEDCDLYQEDPNRTSTWIHLDIRPRVHRIFTP